MKRNETNDSTAIEVRGLRKDFGAVQALKGIDLTIGRGQIFGLLGPNGAGKTTFIRLLTGSTKPTGGRVSLLGLDPVKQKTLVRRQIGYMPQSPALYDDLSPRENIRFFGKGHHSGDLRQRVDEVIEFVGLSERADDAIYKFSGGMKQRISLACALVNEPQVLLLDEPTSGIDPKLREAFWKHFNDLAAGGVTVLVSTHQMDEAMYCDRLAILNKGSLLADDAPRQLLWENRAAVKVMRGNEVEEQVITNYPEALPNLLQRYGLDPSVSRIEIQEEKLENVVLRMINQDQSKQTEEGHDGGDD